MITKKNILLTTAAILFVFFSVQGYCQDNQSTVLIENNSFAVIKDKAQTLAMFIQNNDGTAKYKVVFNETELGEGTLKLSAVPTIIKFGDSRIKIVRIAGNDLQVSVK